MTTPIRALVALLLATLMQLGWAADTPVHAPKDATEATRAAQRAAQERMPRTEPRTFWEQAHRGLIESATDLVLTGPGGRSIRDLRRYGFLASSQVPDTVHPALWQHARLNLAIGLFNVTERLYQVRGLDLANMTIIEGDNGLIVVDPLTSEETARWAMCPMPRPLMPMPR